MSFQFPLATASWGQDEIEAMLRVIKSGMFTMGPTVQTFEQDFARYIGSRHCVMVNSGSSANLLMVAALFYTKNPELKLQRGDEVIVPAVSWSTTYYPLYQYGFGRMEVSSLIRVPNPPARMTAFIDSLL